MLDTADFVPSESILQLKARTLRNQTTPRRGRPASSAPDPELLAPLVDLYNQHEGDLDAIFNVRVRNTPHPPAPIARSPFASPTPTPTPTTTP